MALCLRSTSNDECQSNLNVKQFVFFLVPIAVDWTACLHLRISCCNNGFFLVVITVDWTTCLHLRISCCNNVFFSGCHDCRLDYLPSSTD